VPGALARPLQFSGEIAGLSPVGRRASAPGRGGAIHHHHQPRTVAAVGRIDMNWDQIRGNWNQAKGELKVKWAKLTDDDLELIEGHRDKLVGRLQERYGMSKEEAEREADSFG
jgi:uncharacterized protein YjbJ (UPF0337 family)